MTDEKKTPKPKKPARQPPRVRPCKNCGMPTPVELLQAGLCPDCNPWR